MFDRPFRVRDEGGDLTGAAAGLPFIPPALHLRDDIRRRGSNIGVLRVLNDRASHNQVIRAIQDGFTRRRNPLLVVTIASLQPYAGRGDQ